MKAEWKFGMKIAAARGIGGADFPDLIRVDVNGRWVYVLVSMAMSYIIIKDDAEYPPLYRMYQFEGIEGSIADFIVAEAENPSIRPSPRMENYKRLFKKWEHVYSFSPWDPFEVEEIEEPD